jgi:hypothetical protein
MRLTPVPERHVEDIGSSHNVNTLAGEYLKQLGYDVRVLVRKKVRALLKNRHPTSKTTIRLSEFEADITTSDNN